MDTPELEARLRAHGIRPTRHRLAIARLLLDGRDRHVTAEAVHQEALSAGEPLALATVYNTLNQLRSAGLLGEVVVEQGRSWFDTNTRHHFHVYHEATGLLEDVQPGAAEGLTLPHLPADLRLARVDVVFRVKPAP